MDDAESVRLRAAEMRALAERSRSLVTESRELLQRARTGCAQHPVSRRSLLSVAAFTPAGDVDPSASSTTGRCKG